MKSVSTRVVDVSVGKEVPFEIMTAAAGPGQSSVNISSPSGAQVPCTVSPVPEGSAAKFVPTEAGPHSVQVTFADQPVPGSPFTTVATQVCIFTTFTVTFISWTDCCTYLICCHGDANLCEQLWRAFVWQVYYLWIAK